MKYTKRFNEFSNFAIEYLTILKMYYGDQVKGDLIAVEPRQTYKNVI